MDGETFADSPTENQIVDIFFSEFPIGTVKAEIKLSLEAYKINDRLGIGLYR